MELANPKDKLVLIADDDLDVLSFLETVVAGEGFKVVCVKNGEEALEKVRENPPDLIISDLMMPGQGGYEVLRQLQASENKKIPVVMITASKINDSTIKMIRSEANVLEFIPKPVKINVLLTALHHYLETYPPDIKRLRPPQR